MIKYSLPHGLNIYGNGIAENENTFRYLYIAPKNIPMKKKTTARKETRKMFWCNNSQRKCKIYDTRNGPRHENEIHSHKKQKHTGTPE